MVLEGTKNMNETKDIIRTNFKRFREQAHLSQVALAKLLEVRPSAISNWESGRNSIDIDILFKVCKIYDISIDKMIEDPDDPNIVEIPQIYLPKIVPDRKFETTSTMVRYRRVPKPNKETENQNSDNNYQEVKEDTSIYNKATIDPLLHDLINRLEQMSPRQRAKVVDAIFTLLDNDS